MIKSAEKPYYLGPHIYLYSTPGKFPITIQLVRLPSLIIGRAIIGNRNFIISISILLKQLDYSLSISEVIADSTFGLINYHLIGPHRNLELLI